MNDKEYIIYNRHLGFLTEAGEWNHDIVLAEIFTEADARQAREKFIKADADNFNPVILKWC